MTADRSSTIHALSFDIEDWFHLVEIEGLNDESTWLSRPSIVEPRTLEILDLLDVYDTRATFFVLGWIAERYPALVREIAVRGHELASHSFWHRPVYTQSREAFREDTIRSLDAIERASGVRPCGYRAPSFSIVKGTEWAFDVLHDCGVTWDASLFPGRRGHGGYPCGDSPFMVRGESPLVKLPELPLRLMRVYGRGFCVSGGGYARLLPQQMLAAAFKRFDRRGESAVTYFHPRDFAPDCPVVPMPFPRRFKSYVGLASTRRKLEWLLANLWFAPCSEVLAFAGLLHAKDMT
jgi:polysaccharide deacetylase family protein (PEP-CTERM system associated)